MSVKTKIWKNDFRRRARKVQENIVVAIDDSLIVTEQIARQLAAVDTGEMRSKIRISKHPRYGSLIGEVEAGAAHSKFVEFGTVNMEAQPFMTPAVEQGRRMLNRRMKDVHK